MRKYGETDPAALARAMGVIVAYEPMGSYPEACKGFFMYQSRKKLITVNSDLPETLQRIILAHEIGHAVLHRKALVSLKAFHDFSLYDTTSQFEYEANLFAAEYLLEDQQVIEKLNDDAFFFGVAKELYVPPELLDFKFRILKNKGWALDSPITASGDFLKTITRRRDD
ncbi:hypothetical protein SDC9_123214 [bioreactor metagenome]|uniref:IrrE N-terminal-like domain-containing protein n=1 Tax=bioreactor metagenome TaxID=1076179 RepID=A0A645CGZ6_9ZZZZ